MGWIALSAEEPRVVLWPLITSMAILILNIRGVGYVAYSLMGIAISVGASIRNKVASSFTRMGKPRTASIRIASQETVTACVHV